jgi:hypothetical protein
MQVTKESIPRVEVIKITHFPIFEFRIFEFSNFSGSKRRPSSIRIRRLRAQWHQGPPPLVLRGSRSSQARVVRFGHHAQLKKKVRINCDWRAQKVIFKN